MKKDIHAQPTLAAASVCKASKVVRLAPKATAGATTIAAFGSITDAVQTLKSVVVATETVDTETTAGKPKPLHVTRMMKRDIHAQQTPAAACDYKASRAVPHAPKATAGATITKAFGSIMDAAPTSR